MGFNIATARLATVTKVWSTRKSDQEWFGLEIDFEKLTRQRHFLTPMLTRPKANPLESGTEISVEQLKLEQREWFSRPANRSNLKRNLGLVYAAMLRPNGVPVTFRLMLNRTQVQGRHHCVWDEDGAQGRGVETSRFGFVRAFQPVDQRLPDRPFCTACWQWLQAGGTECPACESQDNVVDRQRRVHGWLGLQRYLNRTDFGIDFVRHGRKLEFGNKDLFVWANDDSPESEYPIDDPRNRGRIVGEIHLDHCRVTYMKDRFDRSDPAWEDMLRIIRGDGPLRPDIARGRGFDQNISPLFLLFQAFRRSSPKPKVAGAWAKLLVVPDNERAEAMAKHHHAGESAYQSDTKWWELVEEADRQLLNAAHGAGADDDEGGLEGFPSGEDEGAGEAAGPEDGEPERPEPVGSPIPSLTQEYLEERTNQIWDVHAFEVDSSHPTLADGYRPWALRATVAGVQKFFVDTDSEVFQSATLTPLDALLAELAWWAMDFQRGQSEEATFAGILTSLRIRYARGSALDPVALSGEANLTLGAIGRGLARTVEPEDARSLFNEFGPTEQAAILQRMATRNVRHPQQLIDNGRFLEYAPRKTLLRFIEAHPDLFFDGRYWDDAYTSLDFGQQAATEEAQSQVLWHYISLLTDAVWLADQEPDDLAEASRERLLRASLALDLLAPGPQAQIET